MRNTTDFDEAQPIKVFVLHREYKKCSFSDKQELFCTDLFKIINEPTDIAFEL